MNSSPSLAGRVFLAVLLMIGFYILAVAMACGLLYIPYAEMVYAERLHLKLALVCLLGALAIIWSVIPRIDKFVAPGPQLTRDQHPQLFAELDAVAKSVNQAMPAEVYLIPDVNAWVSQRGGIMGIGGRRVMGLGLPLMRMLTCSQFRAVLAHEFGHYHGGDTKLGPWIYKTRGAIGRTLQSLGDGSLLQIPFHWYGKMFLRVTHAVSRRQEFVADELAARAVGSEPLIGGLRTIHGVGPVFDAYWANECAPVLNAGFRPPFAEGFQRFVQAAPIADVINRHIDAELKTGKANPYDTHPPLKERIAAVQHLPAGDPGPNDPPATSLLDDLLSLETLLLASLVRPSHACKLKSIGWDEVSTCVYLPQWTTLVRVNASGLAGLTPATLPKTAANLKQFGLKLRMPNGQSSDEGNAEGLAYAVVGAALVVLMVDRGGKVDSEPGHAVSVSVADISVEPFGVLSSLIDGKLTAEDWQSQCRKLGIEDMDLGQVVVA